MQYDTIFFDLDGTLIKSGPAIFATTRATLNEMGLTCPDDEYMHRLIGPPLKIGFRDILGIPEDRVEEAIVRYRENAKTMGIALGAPYEGILPMLKALKEHGLRVGIVTSKVHTTALEQLAAFQISPYVDYVRGAFSDGNGEKTALLEIAVKEFCNLANRPVMVGDRYFDLNAARNVQIDSIGVLYGYGEQAEIEDCNPTHIVQSVQELETLLLS